MDWNKIVPVALVVWATTKIWLDRIWKVLEPVVEEVEQLAKDGVIDKKDRKQIAMKAVAVMQEKGYLKLNFISRMVVGKIVDRIASKLPDFVVTQDVQEIVGEARQ